MTNKYFIDIYTIMIYITMYIIQLKELFKETFNIINLKKKYFNDVIILITKLMHKTLIQNIKKFF